MGTGKNYILNVMRSSKTVFTFKDLSLLWGVTDANNLKKRVYRYVKSGKLYSIRRGIYTKDKNYDKFELATKMYTPSYVSMETVLMQAGVIFQHYDQIFVAGYLTREIEVDGQMFVLRRIKEPILTNSMGIEKRSNYQIASTERAFLDILYLNKIYHFDNLTDINWDTCFDIAPIYKNKNMVIRLEAQYKAHRHARS